MRSRHETVRIDRVTYGPDRATRAWLPRTKHFYCNNSETCFTPVPRHTMWSLTGGALLKVYCDVTDHFGGFQPARGGEVDHCGQPGPTGYTARLARRYRRPDYGLSPLSECPFWNTGQRGIACRLRRRENFRQRCRGGRAGRSWAGFRAVGIPMAD